MLSEGENMTAYDRNNLMDAQYDGSELCHRADEKIKTFQIDGAREAGIFHHLNYSTNVSYYSITYERSY